MPIRTDNGVLSWLDIGDPHIARAGEQNHHDLRWIVALANDLPPGSLDFAFLPGDNADDGTTEQFEWVRAEVAGLGSPLHTYPADLRDGAERLDVLLARPNVRCVDRGHTHYNELANDGGTIFMATRSPGQIEEWSPDFSIAAVDGECVSWRFKPLNQIWPFVLVTRSADRRLVTGPNQTAGGALPVRAKVIGDVAIQAVEVSMNDGDWVVMAPVPGEAALWQASFAVSGGSVRVRARDARGRQDEDAVYPATRGWTPPRCAADGSDRDDVGTRPMKRIFGTQLGPNRNGRKW